MYNYSIKNYQHASKNDMSKMIFLLKRVCACTVTEYKTVGQRKPPRKSSVRMYVSKGILQLHLRAINTIITNKMQTSFATET
jgi:hypothetical protein